MLTGVTDDDDLTTATARAHLLAAAHSSMRLRRQAARWDSRKLAACGVALGVLTVVVGLADSKTVGAAVLAGLGLIVALAVRERRRPAHLPGTHARTSRYMAIGLAFYGVAFGAAAVLAPRDPAYWWPAGVIVALPMLVGAAREWRR